MRRLKYFMPSQHSTAAAAALGHEFAHAPMPKCLTANGSARPSCGATAASEIGGSKSGRLSTDVRDVRACVRSETDEANGIIQQI